MAGRAGRVGELWSVGVKVGDLCIWLKCSDAFTNCLILETDVSRNSVLQKIDNVSLNEHERASKMKEEKELLTDRYNPFILDSCFW